MTTFNNTREIEARISELEDLKEALDEAREEYEEVLGNSDEYELDEVDRAVQHLKEAQREFDPSDQEELRELIDFKTDLESYCDWYGGETLIPEKARVSYAKQLAEDCDNIPPRWPFDHIDWYAAADDLFHSDYHSADLNGSTFYVRMN